MANATEARKVVFELFQDLDGFSLEDYQPFTNVAGRVRPPRPVSACCAGGTGPAGQRVDENAYSIPPADGDLTVRFTTDWELAREQEGIELMGLDHPLICEALQRWQGLDAKCSASRMTVCVRPVGPVLRWKGGCSADGGHAARPDPYSGAIHDAILRAVAEDGGSVVLPSAGFPAPCCTDPRR